MKLTNKEKDLVKITQLKEVVASNFLDVDDLVATLDITVEDLLERFEDRLIDNYEKFIPDGWTEDGMEEFHEREFGNDIEEELETD